MRPSLCWCGPTPMSPGVVASAATVGRYGAACCNEVLGRVCRIGDVRPRHGADAPWRCVGGCTTTPRGAGNELPILFLQCPGEGRARRRDRAQLSGAERSDSDIPDVCTGYLQGAGTYASATGVQDAQSAATCRAAI